MIKFSALLVALAIGLLAAGVAASSLLLVYVAIGVCLVSAVLLAVGVVRHWAEIFGTGSRVPAAGTVPGTALRSAACRAVRGRASRSDSRGRGSGSGNHPRRGGFGLPGRSRPAGTGGGAGRRSPGGWSRDGGTAAGPVRSRGPVPPGRPPAGTRGQASRRREERRPRRKDTGGRPGQAPAGPGPAQPVHPVAASSGHPAPPDDLWERVAEELESAGKRDTGDLAWPAAEFPLPPEPVAPAVPAWAGRAARVVGHRMAGRAGAAAWLRRSRLPVPDCAPTRGCAPTRAASPRLQPPPGHPTFLRGARRPGDCRASWTWRSSTGSGPGRAGEGSRAGRIR